MRQKETVREVMRGMSTREIVLDILHILWYIGWRSAVVLTCFFGFCYGMALLDGVMYP